MIFLLPEVSYLSTSVELIYPPAFLLFVFLKLLPYFQKNLPQRLMLCSVATLAAITYIGLNDRKGIGYACHPESNTRAAAAMCWMQGRVPVFQHDINTISFCLPEQYGKACRNDADCGTDLKCEVPESKRFLPNEKAHFIHRLVHRQKIYQSESGLSCIPTRISEEEFMLSKTIYSILVR